VIDRRLDRPGPLETKITVPGSHALARNEVAGIGSGPVDVQPLAAKDVRESVGAERDDLGPENIRVEGVRPLPVGDGDDNVIEREPQSSRSQ
jgi:hypothetical protein